MNAEREERLVFSCWITLLACGTVREAMWYMKIKTLTSWAGDFTCEAESSGRQILLNFNEILYTTPRVSLLEKLHLRLITAERLWVDTCSQHVASRAEILPALEGFGWEGWEAVPVAGPSKLLCSGFCCLWAWWGQWGFIVRRGGVAELLSFPSHCCLPALCSLEHRAREVWNPNCTWAEEWNFGVCFTAVIKSWPTGDISGFVLVYGWWRGVIVHASFSFLGMFS